MNGVPAERALVLVTVVFVIRYAEGEDPVAESVPCPIRLPLVQCHFWLFRGDARERRVGSLQVSPESSTLVQNSTEETILLGVAAVFETAGCETLNLEAVEERDCLVHRTRRLYGRRPYSGVTRHPCQYIFLSFHLQGGSRPP